MTKTNDKLDEILEKYGNDLLAIPPLHELKATEKAKQAIEAYIKEREKEARIDAIKSYEKVNKLLENEIRIDELKVIAQDGFDDMHGTYDYDRIAETVLDRLAELNGGSEDA